MLVVEQDARIALSISSRAYVLEVGRVALTGSSDELRDDENVRRSYLGLLMVASAFTDFMQYVVSGLASGGIYRAARARARDHPPLDRRHQLRPGRDGDALGVHRWTLITHHGWSYWPAFVATLALSFAGGVVIHRAVIRPVERGSVLRIVIVTIGLLVAINGFIIWEWGGEPQAARGPVRDRHVRPRRSGRVRARHRDDRRRARDRVPPLGCCSSSRRSDSPFAPRP